MRKILLAGAAMLATTGMAMAGNKEPIKISAFVTAKCTVADPADIGFTNDASVGDEATGEFTFSCNFTGANGTGAGALKIAFKSVGGGLSNSADTSGVKSYLFTYGSNPPVTAANLQSLGAEYPELSSGPGATNLRNFNVELAQALTVAGTYSDTIDVTVSP